MLLHFLEFVLETLVDAKSERARRRLWLALLAFLASNGALLTTIGLSARGAHAGAAVALLGMFVLLLVSALLFVAGIFAEGRSRGQSALPWWPMWLLGAVIVLVPPPMLLVLLGVLLLYRRFVGRKRASGVKERM